MAGYRAHLKGLYLTGASTIRVENHGCLGRERRTGAPEGSSEEKGLDRTQTGTAHAVMAHRNASMITRPALTMLRIDRCLQCHKRVRPDATRCMGCGAFAAEPSRAEDRRRARGRLFLTLFTTLAVAGILAFNYSDRFVPAVADWYTGMVLRFAPEVSHQLAPSSADDQAFHVCARAVARRVGTESSIATFAGSEAAITRTMDDGRIQVRSYLDESAESRSTHRHIFKCTLRRSEARWVLDELELEPIERLPAELAAIAP